MEGVKSKRKGKLEVEVRVVNTAGNLKSTLASFLYSIGCLYCHKLDGEEGLLCDGSVLCGIF